MSEPLPENADVRQLRIQAKELLRTLQNGETLVDGAPQTDAKLADAQRLIARQYGFSSWPRLVDQVETPALIEKFKQLIDSGDAVALERLLRTKSVLRKQLNEPLFAFDSPALVRASYHPEAAKLLPVLARYGADPNGRSKWWAGGFSALDSAQGKAVEVLLELGARFDVWSAAKQGRLEILRELLDKDPASVNAPGGDGECPLHFAANSEIAGLLIARGADLELRDVDHESTPVQYQINQPEVLRILLAHGAKPDIFTAAALNDIEMARRLLADDPSAVDSRVGLAPFTTTESEGGHIYTYLLGGGKTPHQVAAERGHHEVLEELLKHGPITRRVIAAAWLEDGETVAALLQANPEIKGTLAAEGHVLADAAQAGRTETVRLLLEAGADPTIPGMDSGSALHVACWFGHLPVVELLLDQVALDLRDAHHGSTPLGWACHGAQWCRNPQGDYPKVVEALLRAGANPNEAANSGGTPMLEQAGNREDVKEVLRRYIAR